VSEPDTGARSEAAAVDERERATGAGVVVFLGPSLSIAEAKAVLPHATYLPPVEQGDLITIASAAQGPRPWGIGIVDGVFYQSLPVWHKEILFALEKGMRVFGASSMGALRAVECAPFGMVGVGEVFRRYASGELTDDDEVALAHDDAEQDWRGRSEPLVNVRATLEAAVSRGLLDETVASAVVSAAKQLWFPNRTIDRILEAAAASGIEPVGLAVVRDVLDNAYVDVKRADALALLTAMSEAGRELDGQASASADEPAGAVGPGASSPPPVRVVRSGMFWALFDRDRRVAHEDVTLRREEIARHVALSNADFAELRDRASDRLLLEELADVWRVEATQEDVDAERQRLLARLKLYDDAAFDAWRRDNDLSPEELDTLLASEARLRRLRDWVNIARSRRLLVDAVLTQLKLQGSYQTWVERTAEHEKAAAALGDARVGDGSGPGELDQLIRDQIRAGGWRPEVPFERFVDEAGFHDADDLVSELARRRRVRDARREAVELLESLFGDDGGAGSAEVEAGPDGERAG
jgi:hypothetical protein